MNESFSGSFSCYVIASVALILFSVLANKISYRIVTVSHRLVAVNSSSKLVPFYMQPLRCEVTSGAV